LGTRGATEHALGGTRGATEPGWLRAPG